MSVPQFAEVNAIELTVDWVFASGQSNCIIEYDCNKIIDAVVSLSSPSWASAIIAQSIRSKIKCKLDLVFHFVRHDGNRVASY